VFPNIAHSILLIFIGLGDHFTTKGIFAVPTAALVVASTTSTDVARARGEQGRSEKRSKCAARGGTPST
jgi:hypothetical protein